MRYPLLHTVLAGLRAHAVRLLLTATAIMVGVSFLAGSLVYGDTARAAFYDDLARSARNVDVAVQPSYSLLDRDVVDQLANLDGVAAVDGRVIASLGMLGRDGRLLLKNNHVGYGLSLPDQPSLSRFDLAQGRLPRAAGEIAVEKKTVENQAFTVGGRVSLVDADGKPRAFTLVGVLDLGVNRLFGGSSVAALTDGDLTELTGTARYAEVVLTAADGVSQRELRDRVGARLDGNRVITGAELREELAVEAAKYVDGFLSVLIGFGLVALTVSGFVIYNTFAILAAQRVRELALLRCVGASRPQVFAMVLLEAAVLGVVASLGGLALSLVVGWGLIFSRGLVGSEIPTHSLVVGGLTVAVAVGFGTALTLLGALVPTVGATRVPPLAALREAGSTEHRSGSGRRRTTRLAIGGGLGGLGLLGILAGLPLAFTGLPLVLGGAMLAFLGLVVLAPLVVGPLIRAVGAVPARLLGIPVRLATVNAQRNPRRVAATTTALMIGVSLMSLFSVLLATAREQSGRELTENFPVEFVLAPQELDGAPRGGTPSGVPQDAIDALAGSPELAIVAPVRTAQLSLAGERDFPDGGRGSVWAVPPDVLRAPIVPEVTEGSLAGFRPGTAAVGRDLAESQGLGLGDQLDLGALGPASVVALYDDAPVDHQVLVSWEAMISAYGESDADQVLVDVADGASTVAARQRIDAVLRDHPLIQVSSMAEAAESLSASLDELLAIFGALLGMSVLIALFGIGNTLSLSVFERTRESATLRALGLTARQLRLMLLSEAALMALVGAFAGIAFGGSVGWAAALGLIRTYGHGLPTLPVGQLALFALISAVAAMVATLLPARRAARASIVAAMIDT